MTVQKDPERTEVTYLRRIAKTPRQHVLEIGCGDGRLTWRYAREAHRVTGIDMDWDGIRIASIERPSDLESTTTFAHADAIHLPFAGKAFDLGILSWSF